MSLILIEVPFFRGISEGWLAYYNGSKNSDPLFTENQIRMADQAANVLDNCYPIIDIIGSETHLKMCQNLGKNQFIEASQYLETELPVLNKANCFEALKWGFGY